MADELTQEQAQAEWTAMAAEREGAPAVVAPSPVEELPKEEPTAEPAPVAPADPYEGLPAAAREKLAAFDQLVTQNNQLALQLKEFAGRVSTLQSEFAKSRQAQSADAPNQAQIAAAAKDPEQWESLKKDFPEWGSGIEAFVDARLGRLAGHGLTADQVQQMVAQQAGAMAQEHSAQVNEMFVAYKYPDWKDTVKTPEFAQWHAAQPPEIRQLADSPSAFDALKMLDIYAEFKAKPATVVKQQRQDRLASAVTGAPGKTAPVKTFEDMSPKEQWDYLAAERSKAQG